MITVTAYALSTNPFQAPWVTRSRSCAGMGMLSIPPPSARTGLGSSQRPWTARCAFGMSPWATRSCADTRQEPIPPPSSGKGIGPHASGMPPPGSRLRYAPRHDNVELAPRGILAKPIERSSLVAALRTADAMVLADLDHFAAHAPGDRAQLGCRPEGKGRRDAWKAPQLLRSHPTDLVYGKQMLAVHNIMHPKTLLSSRTVVVARLHACLESWQAR
jgi:hypothetical protein